MRPRALPQRGPRHTRARGPLVSGSRGFPSGSPSALRPLAAVAAHAPRVCPPGHGVLRKKATDRPEKSCVRTAREVRAVCFSNGLWGGEAAGRSRPPPPQGTWAAVTEDMSPGGLAGNSCPSGSRGTTARYGGDGGQLPRPDSARGAPGGSASRPPAPGPPASVHRAPVTPLSCPAGLLRTALGAAMSGVGSPRAPPGQTRGGHGAPSFQHHGAPVYLLSCRSTHPAPGGVRQHPLPRAGRGGPRPSLTPCPLPCSGGRQPEPPSTRGSRRATPQPATSPSRQPRVPRGPQPGRAGAAGPRARGPLRQRPHVELAQGGRCGWPGPRVSPVHVWLALS